MKKLLLYVSTVLMALLAGCSGEINEGINEGGSILGDPSDTNKIFYTTTDGKKFFPPSTDPSLFGAVLISNTYANGQGALTFDDVVTTIGENAFYGCSSLASITIPDSVTSIGDSAFYNCTSLTSVTIGDSVTSIGYEAFHNCTSLENVHITDIAAWCKIVFNCAPLTYACNLYLNGELVTDLVIPDSVTSIGRNAFQSCSCLTSVTIPDSVTSIESNAFAWCESLTSVTIPDSVTLIGNYAFYDCTSLTSVTIGNGVTSIGRNAFRGCSCLTSVTIPDSVTSIGDNAFDGCTSLTSVYITDIAAWCGISFSNPAANPFYYANNLYLNGELVTKLVIPDSVTSIGELAFDGCTSLTSINIPDSVTSIGDYAFRYCSSLTSVHITDIAAWCGISFRGWYANPLHYANNLYLNGELVTNLVIPDSVTSIGDYAFYHCTSLTSVTIGDSVTSIGEAAFSDCTSLTSVTIPDSVTSIGICAFSDCTSLASVYCKAVTPPAGGLNMFGRNASERKIYVPTASVEAYKAANYWSYDASAIVGYDFE